MPRGWSTHEHGGVATMHMHGLVARRASYLHVRNLLRVTKATRCSKVAVVFPASTLPLITSLPDENALCERGQPNARAGQGVARAPLLLSQVPGAAHADIYKQLNCVSRSDRKVANCSSARSGQHGDRRAGGARNPCLARAPRRRTGTGAHNSAPSISSPRSATAS